MAKRARKNPPVIHHATDPNGKTACGKKAHGEILTNVKSRVTCKACRSALGGRSRNPLGLEYGARVHVQAKDQTGHSVRGVCTVLGQANEKHLVVQGQDGKVWIVARSACRKANGEPSLEEAKRRYEGFHWGEPAARVEKVRVPSAAGHALVELGEMTAVAYRTNKAGKVEEYEHKFKKPRPVLAMDEEENLLVVGGGYKVEDRGIVD